LPNEPENSFTAGFIPVLSRRMNSLQKAIALSANLLRIAVGKPKRLSHVLGTALHASNEVVDSNFDLLRLRPVDVNQLLPESGQPWRILLDLFPQTYASVSVLEFTCLVLLMKSAKATRIFEFGTYMGVSITQFALNLPPESVIYTLDLPDNTTNTLLSISDPDEAAIAFEKRKGALVPPDVKPRVTFLEKDSAAFDESPLAGLIDFVFVDGAHSYDYVKNDSEKGWRMLRSGGVMAWHDFRMQDPDVVRYLLESPYQPARILNTSLAFARKP
jgi:predicted O-methyltransferase YrrM